MTGESPRNLQASSSGGHIIEAVKKKADDENGPLKALLRFPHCSVARMRLYTEKTGLE